MMSEFERSMRVCLHVVHHIQPRSEGGRNEAQNLLVLSLRTIARPMAASCASSMTATGASASGTAMAPLTGRRPRHNASDAHTKVFSALRPLGFREGEEKAMLAELRADIAVGVHLQQPFRSAAPCQA